MTRRHWRRDRLHLRRRQIKRAERHDFRRTVRPYLGA